jgi:hypothetical protein
MRTSLRTCAPFGALVVLAGCAATTFRPAPPSLEVAAASPLGAGYVLLPKSNDDRSLIGKLVMEPPGAGKSLEDVAKPNECADKLGPPKEEPVVATFEDAQGLALGDRKRATLQAFGLEDEDGSGTHFYYRLDVEKRSTVTVTPEYATCCKDKGTCGYGVITALGYGQGEFAVVGEESAGRASIQIPVSQEERGFINARFLRKKYVYGYIAALVAVADPATAANAKPLSLLGDPKATAAEPTIADLPPEARARYEEQRIEVVPYRNKTPGFAYAFKDGTRIITENDFARRYEGLTGAKDLSDAQRNRNPFWLYYGFASAGVSVFLLSTSLFLTTATPNKTEYFGTNPPVEGTQPDCNFSTLQNIPMQGWEIQCNPPVDPSLGKGFAIAGAAVAGTSLASFITYAVLGYDGTAGEHVMTKSDADAYAARYNRALLRASVRGASMAASQPATDSHDLAPQMVLTPVVGPGFAGLSGKF